MGKIQRAVSPAGTSWQGAIIKCINKRVKLKSVMLSNSNSNYAEAGYISFSEVEVTSAQERSADKQNDIITPVHGHIMDKYDLCWNPDIELPGPFWLIGQIFHDSSIAHEMRALWEVIEE